MKIIKYEITPLHGRKGTPVRCTVEMESKEGEKSSGVIALTLVLELENADWSLLQIEERALRHCGQQLLLMANDASDRYKAARTAQARASE